MQSSDTTRYASSDWIYKGIAYLLTWLTLHKNGLRIKSTGGGLGQTTRRQRSRHRHARSIAASRTCAQMRSPQLAHKNKLAAKGIGGVKQSCPGHSHWPVLT